MTATDVVMAISRMMPTLRLNNIDYYYWMRCIAALPQAWFNTIINRYDDYLVTRFTMIYTSNDGKVFRARDENAI